MYLFLSPLFSIISLILSSLHLLISPKLGQALLILGTPYIDRQINRSVCLFLPRRDPGLHLEA